MGAKACRCLACTGAPTIAVAVEHDALRQLIVVLLSRDDVTWGVCPCVVTDVAETAAAHSADVAVVATSDFPASCVDLLDVLPRSKVIVIGPEPEVAYERAARDAGAGAWISRDRIGEDLLDALHTVLGCRRGTDGVALV
jgi:hypothetical protein